MLHDPRLTPVRSDLAALHLKGELDAESFVAGTEFQVIESVASVHEEPSTDAPQLTQALFGEIVTVYEEKDGWVWGQLRSDDYVGYLPVHALSQKLNDATHRVRTLRTYVYSKASIKSPPLHLLSLNSLLSVAGQQDEFTKLNSGGFVFTDHLYPIGIYEKDFVEVAERFVGTPYFWGGKTSLGLDCSALVQMSLMAVGRPTRRDSYMLQDQLGSELTVGEDLSGLRRGDLVFWKGHVGVMCDETRFLHCNGYHMTTIIEPLSVTRERIARMFGNITMFKRMEDYSAG